MNDCSFFGIWRHGQVLKANEQVENQRRSVDGSTSSTRQREPRENVAMRSKGIAAVAMLAGIISKAALAEQGLPERELSYVGSVGGLAQYKERERPFWAEKIPSASGGSFKPKVVSYDQIGIT